MKKIVIIDNYDSFTYNIYQLLSFLKNEVIVLKNDDKFLFNTINKFSPNAIIISPGPKRPKDANFGIEVVKKMGGKVPILGVCLGMQIINEVFGGKTVKLKNPIHGMTSLIYHENDSIFKNVPSPFASCRYHSLTISNIPKNIRVIAKTKNNIPMAIKHTSIPNLYGIQFHPESFLSECGKTLFSNFLS